MKIKSTLGDTLEIFTVEDNELPIHISTDFILINLLFDKSQTEELIKGLQEQLNNFKQE